MFWHTQTLPRRFKDIPRNFQDNLFATFSARMSLLPSCKLLCLIDSLIGGLCHVISSDARTKDFLLSRGHCGTMGALVAWILVLWTGWVCRQVVPLGGASGQRRISYGHLAGLALAGLHRKGYVLRYFTGAVRYSVGAFRIVFIIHTSGMLHSLAGVADPVGLVGDAAVRNVVRQHFGKSWEEGMRFMRTKFTIAAAVTLTVNNAQCLTLKEGVVMHLVGGVTLQACFETRPSIRRMDALGKFRNDSLQAHNTM